MITNWSQRLISQVVTAAKTRRGLSGGDGDLAVEGRREGEMIEAGERNYRRSRHPKRLRRRGREIASKRERGNGRGVTQKAVAPYFEPSLPSCKVLRATWHSPSVTSLSLSLSLPLSSSFLGRNTPVGEVGRLPGERPTQCRRRRQCSHAREERQSLLAIQPQSSSDDSEARYMT